MSHIAHVALNTELTCRPELIAAFREVGAQVVEGGSIPLAGNGTAAVDLAVTLPHGLGSFGFRRVGDRYELAVDWVMIDLTEDALRTLIHREYAVQRTLSQARAAGWTDIHIKRSRSGEVQILHGNPEVVDVRVTNSGEAVIETSGFRGDACLAATSPIEHALGTVTKRHKKGEGYLAAGTRPSVRLGRRRP